MAQAGVQLDRRTFFCMFCSDLPRCPVTIPCGHSYCMLCIRTHWDKEDQNGRHSCPQCGKAFAARPSLVKNTILAALLEKMEKTAAPADHRLAGPDDVACDACSQRKWRAFKSCLLCRKSYCEKHLKRFHDTKALEKHKLVKPVKDLMKNICRHDEEVMMFFTLEKQYNREGREKDLMLLQHEMETINLSADKAVAGSEKVFSDLILLLEKRRSAVKQQVRSRQEAEISRMKELQERLGQEIVEVKKRDNNITESTRSSSTDSSVLNICPQRFFQEVPAAVLQTRDKLHGALRDTWTNISLMVAEVDVLLSPPEPKTRAGFLKHAWDITLDPNSAHRKLLLSEGNRKATVANGQPYPSHPDRFTDCCQVLSTASLPGRCYWEVRWSGPGRCIGVSYNSVVRTGNTRECWFGLNDKSWVFKNLPHCYGLLHNGEQIRVSGPPLSTRLGLYLDQSAGILSLYSITETMTLLHRVQTTFTEPLYAAFGLFGNLSYSTEICKLKQT